MLLSTIVARMQSAIMNWHGLQKNVRLDHNGQTQPLQTLKALGYEDHQYMIVAHDDKKHFHIHIMVNKVHPETLRAPTPYRNWLALDAAARTRSEIWLGSYTGHDTLG